MKDLEKFIQQFKSIKDMSVSDGDFEELEELEYQVEMEMYAIDDMRLDEFKKLSKLRTEILQFIQKHKKEDKPSFDREAELDRMFPDRHDEDFDDESMSWDSIYGDD